MNNLQLYRQIAPEVFARYNRDKDSFELFTLQTFIDNINNERVKNKKDAREEFKTVKKNVKSEALKEIVKDLEQAIFGDNDNDEDLLEAKELDRRFKNLVSKKRHESLREYLKESEDDNPQDRVNALKEYLKKAKYTDLQIKVNNLLKTSSDNNDDSEDNQISDFVDEVLKKVSKEIVNDDDKKVSKEIVNDDNKKVSKEIVNDNKKVSKEIVNDDNKKASKEIVNDDNKKVSKEIVNHDNKKVSKEIVHDDNKKVSKEIVNDDAKKKSNQKSKENITERIKKMEASENLFNKQFRDAKEILELSKKYKESNAKKDKMLRLKIEKRLIKILIKHLKNITQKKHKGRLKK